MATITDFDAWLDEADPEGYEEVHALYRAIVDCDEFGLYQCKSSQDETKWFVKAGGAGDTLMLASVEAKNAFLKRIDSKYVDSELDMESWYHFNRNMEKND